MGIKGLTKLLADNAPNAMKEQKLESYFGRRIAVDASMSIYQFLVVVGRKGTQMLTNEAGEVTGHLQGMLYRTIRLYVFDGRPPDLKKQELAKRFSKRAAASEELAVTIAFENKEDREKFSKRTVKVTQQHNGDCKKLLRLMISQLLRLQFCLKSLFVVYAVASEDMDSLTFGAPIFLRHLMDPISRKVPVMEFEISKILEEMNLDMDQFVDRCILSGCDYFESIQGIGGLTALKLISQHGSIENILENINKQRCFLFSDFVPRLIPDNWPYSEARLLFKGPIVSTEEQPEIKWTAPNKEGLISFLMNENGFNIDRVTNAIEKIKAAKDESSQGRVGSKCTFQFPSLAFKPKIFSTQVSVNPQPRVLGSFKMPTVVLGLRNFKQPLRVVCMLTWI
ncbi:hypothetical protein EUGRSUZ_B01328 [Eucalyptus grandis]|uniref:Uncharacterized protein n=2 Tax=Eucalyptus grandis TaxID=71139 RepID=A0ACC3LRZ0_EUCGR|nr:hypothetical protein EUGRSUZ_B01328 [Eucalyptus grandis]